MRARTRNMNFHRHLQSASESLARCFCRSRIQIGAPLCRDSDTSSRTMHHSAPRASRPSHQTPETRRKNTPETRRKRRRGRDVRAAFEASVPSTDEKAVETHRVDTEDTNPQAEWQHVDWPSSRLAARIQEFEGSADDPDPNRRGFKLADGQWAICKRFGRALDVALDEEMRQVPVRERTQSACLLIGAGGTGKTTIILELLLPTFLEFFPAQDGEDRYAILTFFPCTRRCNFERHIPGENSIRCCWLQSC